MVAVGVNLAKITPVLVFGYGNPGRGDDALGVLAAEALAALHLPHVECLTDMQLQVEHVTDLVGRERILFVDADVNCSPPYVLETVTAQQDDSYSSHAMTPAALLYAFRQVYDRDAPPAQVLRIRGYSFGLGEGLSAQGQTHLNAVQSVISTVI